MTDIKQLRNIFKKRIKYVSESVKDIEKQINRIEIKGLINSNLKLNMQYIHDNSERLDNKILKDSLYEVQELYRLKIDWSNKTLDRIQAEKTYINTLNTDTMDDEIDLQIINVKKRRLEIEEMEENPLELRCWTLQYDKVSLLINNMEGKGVKKRKRRKTKKRKTR